jgi:hypothetical protein
VRNAGGYRWLAGIRGISEGQWEVNYDSAVYYQVEVLRMLLLAVDLVDWSTKFYAEWIGESDSRRMVGKGVLVEII